MIFFPHENYNVQSGAIIISSGVKSLRCKYRWLCKYLSLVWIPDIPQEVIECPGTLIPE